MVVVSAGPVAPVTPNWRRVNPVPALFCKSRFPLDGELNWLLPVQKKKALAFVNQKPFDPPALTSPEKEALASLLSVLVVTVSAAPLLICTRVAPVVAV